MDADVYGPSIPQLLGVNDAGAPTVNENKKIVNIFWSSKKEYFLTNCKNFSWLKNAKRVGIIKVILTSSSAEEIVSKLILLTRLSLVLIDFEISTMHLKILIKKKHLNVQ